MDSIVIGLGHKTRRGKDEAARTIIAQRGDRYDVRRYAFADALKREVNEAAEKAGGMFGLITKLSMELGEQFTYVGADSVRRFVTYEPDADMTDPLCPLGKQRALLQWWGTEYRRARNPFYWITKLRETLQKEKPQFALITDMRFPNEFYFIKHFCKGYTVRCDRLGYQDGLAATHASETALDSMPDNEWSYIIKVNDGDVEELRKDAVFVFDNIIELMTPPNLEVVEAQLDAIKLSGVPA